MKFDVKVINTDKRFRIEVYLHGTETLVHDCGYHGGYFNHKGVWYHVVTPYHGMGERIGVYALAQASILV